MKFKLIEEFLDEASIDLEDKYTDFGTGKVTNDNIFDEREFVFVVHSFVLLIE